tara:strand:+ start:411 stop:1268 length:858 start_codon:yes stop_codon:yes gene_type:complete
MTEVQTNPVEEKAPNPYNAKKSWHTPDNPKMESADGLFYAPSQEQQATPSEEESEKPPAKSSKDVNYKKRYDDLKKHYDTRISEFKQREQELVAEASENAPAYQAPKTLEELEEFKAKNPDLYETVETVAHLQSETQTETLRQQLSALQEREADILKREAETMLRERHPDFEDIRGDDAFHEWAKEQPEAIQQWIYANNSDGTLASRAIDLYKMERGIVQPPQKRQSKTKEQRSAADMVSTKTTAVDSKAPKVWTEKEIASMSIDQFDRYESEIKLALSEGRIAK